jgi:predicted DNA binding protein
MTGPVNKGRFTRLSDLAAQYGMAKSTILTILKNKEAIKVAKMTSKNPYQ